MIRLVAFFLILVPLAQAEAQQKRLHVGNLYSFDAPRDVALSPNGKSAVYVRQWIDPATKARVSDNNEYDFTLDYRFTAKHWPDWLKPLWLRARAAHVEERLAGAVRVTNDYRLISNYEWKF